MKKMNQALRGVVAGVRMTCGVRAARPHLERNLADKGEHYWARKRGERPSVVGASLLELERKLAAI